MHQPAWDNLDDFLDPGDFAVPAVCEDGRSFPVIIEERYFSHDLGGYIMDAPEPWAIAKQSDGAGLKKRNRLTINNVVYFLTDDPQPDGTGMITLPLSRYNAAQK